MKKMTETEKKAVVYMRVNANGVGDPVAVERQLAWQRARCEAVAKVYGLPLVKEYSDIDGATDIKKRPELRRLLDELPADEIRYLVVSDLARLSRNVRDLIAIEDRLTQAGVTLLVYGEGPIQARVRGRIATVLADFDANEARHA